MAESGITKQALLALNQVSGVRVWIQKVRKMPDPHVPGAWVQFGIEGMADISGIGPHGVKLEIEMKKGKGHRNKKTIAAQARWRVMILKHGGIYIKANTAADAVEQLKAELARRFWQHERKNK